MIKSTQIYIVKIKKNVYVFFFLSFNQFNHQIQKSSCNYIYYIHVYQNYLFIHINK